MNVGTQIAWNMLDNNTMSGVITFVGFDTFLVRRVDGGTCELPKTEARKATSNEILAACRFFRTLGR